MSGNLLDRVDELERRMERAEGRLVMERLALPNPVPARDVVPPAPPMAAPMRDVAQSAPPPVITQIPMAPITPPLVATRAIAPPIATPPIATRAAVLPTALPPVATRAIAPPIAPRPAMRIQPPAPPAQSASHTPAATPAPAVLTYQPPRPVPAATSREPREVEQFIGLKLAAWVGAIVLVIGLAFGIKFGYDQGWFGRMPPVLRVALMYLGGFSLIAAGEVVYRKVNERSAVGLYAAGVAALFLVSFAGHRFYNLYSPNAAFALMAVSTFVGAVVAARGNLVSIASLSLLGANVIPIILGSQSASIVPFLTYLLALQLVALSSPAKGRPENGGCCASSPSSLLLSGSKHSPCTRQRKSRRLSSSRFSTRHSSTPS